MPPPGLHGCLGSRQHLIRTALSSWWAAPAGLSLQEVRCPPNIPPPSGGCTRQKPAANSHLAASRLQWVRHIWAQTLQPLLSARVLHLRWKRTKVCLVYSTQAPFPALSRCSAVLRWLWVIPWCIRTVHQDGHTPLLNAYKLRHVCSKLKGCRSRQHTLLLITWSQYNATRLAPWRDTPALVLLWCSCSVVATLCHGNLEHEDLPHF
jgi:hypothetical protein